ncbi:ribulokinase [Paraglaciecola hydrolytica]|uniref:Ribulokinase n=1 Tax=Paraglaciecola hydrolytica TaxID=1799789 RepID=A0A148KLI0_9ALTE|nr:ribulokinase [Paraglaciecola hydrolytica]KXI27140.1 ribulokinase [Paraglaciecola hydrolytica]
MSRYVLGLDYGSDSVRALLVDTSNGAEIADHMVVYPRWNKGLYCAPERDQFRQHPQDYLDSLEEVMAGLWWKVSAGIVDKVVGLSIDTTGSTPVAINKQGVPLALTPEFSDNPNAMFVLWKDHTAIKEAAEITQKATANSINYISNMGGVYSSEWYWAKALHVLRSDEQVRKAAYSWVEHCDWLTAVLTDTTDPSVFKMGRCAAGHKIMWNEQWGGFPPNDFFVAIDPLLDGLVDTLNPNTQTSAQVAGRLTQEWAAKLGLPVGIAVGYGAFDCHMGAVAANVKPGVLTKVMGTSTCDITVVAPQQLAGASVKGICGQVTGSVIPGMIGLEAGQSAFGDLYAWFKNVLNWPMANIKLNIAGVDANAAAAIKQYIEQQTLRALSDKASQIMPKATDVVALDWINGRRTPVANQGVSMAIQGIKMGTDASYIFKALVEATAFGSKAITDCFTQQGVPVNSIVVIGGISKKSDYVMQTCADIWNCQIDVLKSEQSCALGAAIFASVAAGVFATVSEAQASLASPVYKSYLPNPERVPVYEQLYAKYQALGCYESGEVA